MKTSNFTRFKDHPLAVSIALRTPPSYAGRTYPQLAPPPHLVDYYRRGMINEDEFRIRYYAAILDKLDPYKVFEELGEDAILLCFCKMDEFCHRRIVAEWLENALNIEVEEAI